MNKCRCGLERDERSGVFVCNNCDNVQEQETGLDPSPRQRTQNDTKYDLYWTQQMREYPPLSDKDESDIRALFE